MSLPADRPRAAVVVNPAKVDIERFRAVVASEEARSDWLPTSWFPTSAEDDGRAAVDAALAAEPDVVLVAGGDGTLREAAEKLRGTSVPLALIPVGTANNFARELRLPMNDLTGAVSIAFVGADRSIDVGLAEVEREDGSLTRHTFLVMAGIGVDAQMAANVSKPMKKRIGWLAYVDPIARSVIGNKQFDLTYRLDDASERKTRAHTVIVGNSGYLPAGLLLLPDAVIDDGLLDAVILRPGRGPGWWVIGMRIAFNRMLRHTRFGRRITQVSPRLRSIRWAQASKLSIRLAEPQVMQFDGDAVGAVSAATITVDYHGLVMRLPEQSARP
ncbi:diacylglycerol kinase family protein [Microbacterium sp. EST19A]|uniref:diacylglycerol/lipid kinase family protein n=1 Tax=Microbacterium sp. EST19A TaxID=2862681 RepID=UPI001CC19A4F|nr:diacylglycerol kinase family protein [Microbacterium sp. EST19A]